MDLTNALIHVQRNGWLLLINKDCMHNQMKWYMLILCFLHREPSPGCLQFPQIHLRAKSCIEPPKTAYCGSGMQGGEESERQSLIKTHQGEIKSPL